MRVGVWAALCSVLCASAIAHAEPRLALALINCEGPTAHEVRGLMAVELRTTPVALADWGAEDAIDGLITVRCQFDGASLLVENFALDKMLQRELDLRAVSIAIRSRTIAVSLVELIADGFVEFRQPRSVAALPTPAPMPRPHFPSQLHLVLEGGATGFFTNFGLLAGGGVRLSHFLPHHLGWAIDINAAHNQRDVIGGSVAATTITSGAQLLFHLAHQSLLWWIGPGVRAGAVRLAGGSNDPIVLGTAFWAPRFGPTLSTGIDFQFFRRLVANFAVEGGYDALPARGVLLDQSRVSLEGFWLGARLGIGVAFLFANR